MMVISTCFLVSVLRDGLRNLNPYAFLYGSSAVSLFKVPYVISISVNGVGLTSALIYMAP
jgi:hypothetical protein